MDDAEDLAQHLGLGGEKEPQGIGECEHPLPNGLFRQHMIDQVGGGLDHPARPTGRAEAAAFAAEGNEMLVAAGIAFDAQEPVLE